MRSSNLFEGHSISGMTWSSDERLNSAKIKLDGLIDRGIGIRVHEHRFDLLPREAPPFDEISN